VCLKQTIVQLYREAGRGCNLCITRTPGARRLSALSADVSEAMLSYVPGDISQLPTERTLQRITALHTLLGYAVRVSYASNGVGCKFC
jgi:hypothetical protein